MDRASSIGCSQVSFESVFLQVAMPALPPVTSVSDSDGHEEVKKRPAKKAKASPKKPTKGEALEERSETTPTKPKSKASPKASCGCVASCSFFCLHQVKSRCC